MKRPTSKKYSGRNKRGQIRIPEHAHPLVRRFVEELNEQQATYAEVSERSGVGVDTLRFWMTRHMPRLDIFDAALNTLGLELTIKEKSMNRASHPLRHSNRETHFRVLNGGGLR